MERINKSRIKVIGFILGVIATACFLVVVGICAIKSGDHLSTYRIIVDVLACGASIATISALGFAYFGYRSWFKQLELQRLDKCVDAIEARIDFFLNVRQEIPKNTDNLHKYYNSIVELDIAKTSIIISRVLITGLDGTENLAEEIKQTRMLSYSEDISKADRIHSVTVDKFQSNVVDIIVKSQSHLASVYAHY